jgi:hypothetical protein
MNNNRPFVRTSRTTGIDKLMLTSQAFIVRDASKTGLQVKHGFTDLATGEQNNPYLFTDKTGRKIEGVSAFLNTDHYQLNINKYGLQVVFNPSKAYHPYELCTDINVLQERIETLSKDINGKGIRLDIEQAKISRFDLARNGIMNEPCIAYSPVLSWLNIKRSKRNAMYPDGHSSNNNRFGINLYNKGKELRNNGIELITDDKMMRCELQYKGSQSVNKRTEISTVQSLYEYGMDHLNKLYTETLSQDVFKAGQSNQLQIAYTDIKEFLSQLKQTYGRNAMQVFYSTYGVSALINDIGNIDTFKNILQDLGFGRTAIWKHEKRILEYMNVQRMIRKTSGIGKLYKELYYKFAA